MDNNLRDQLRNIAQNQLLVVNEIEAVLKEYDKESVKSALNELGTPDIISKTRSESRDTLRNWCTKLL
jgi:hypothetical protein